MKFKNDRQRKACFAQLNKFAVRSIEGLNPEIVEGYTGSRLVTDPYGGGPPFVMIGNTPIKINDTAILPGERYKMQPTREDVIRLRTAENIAGMPVYSEEPKQKELIPGGYGAGRPHSDFDPEQLAKGIEVEKEHVIKFTDKGNVRKFSENDLRKAAEVSCDHLSEIPDYYDRLEVMEEKAKEDGVFINVEAEKKLQAKSSEFSEKIYPETINDISSDLSYMQQTIDAAKAEQLRKPDYYPFAEVDVNKALRVSEPILERHRNIPLETKSYEQKKHFYNARPDQGVVLGRYAEEL